MAFDEHVLPSGHFYIVGVVLEARDRGPEQRSSSFRGISHRSNHHSMTCRTIAAVRVSKRRQKAQGHSSVYLSGLSEIHTRVHRNAAVGPGKEQDPPSVYQVPEQSTGNRTSGPSWLLSCSSLDNVQSKSVFLAPLRSGLRMLLPSSCLHFLPE